MKICRFTPTLCRFFILTLLCVLTCSGFAAQADGTKIKVDPEAAQNYTALAKSISPIRIAKTIHDLSAISYTVPNQPAGASVIAHSRMAGTPGGDQARDYVLKEFTSIFGSVTQEPITVTVPTDNGAALTAPGMKPVALQPLWPNLVRTSTLPQAGVDGQLIYAGNGELPNFRGKKVEGSIVLLDFNCGDNWQNAARYGAKAILFVEPNQMQRGEGETKYLRLPIAIPRFWVSRADAALLQSAALTTADFAVHLTCDNPWRVGTASNIIGKIPGHGPLASQVVVIESYYDSMSVVPTQAPGAESACGIASLLELARAYKAHPPLRTIWFVASGAHFLGIQGARTYIDAHMNDWRPLSAGDHWSHTVFHRPLPDRSNVLIFSGLDLSSQTGKVGVFYKADFYDVTDDVTVNFSDIGRTLRENAAKIGQVLGFDPGMAFADGINGENGKTWRNFLPGDFAFDAEAATLAGGKGITFATTDDSRQLVDTPEDVESGVNPFNLASQTRVLACQYWHLLNDTNDPYAVPASSPKGLVPIPEWPGWTRQGLQLGFSRLRGRVLLFDPKTNFVPDKPIPGSLAVVGNLDNSMTGVRGNLIQATAGGTSNATFDFPGMPLVISNGTGLRFGKNGPIHLDAFRLHSADDAQGSRGDIDYAPDQGVNGAANYPITFDMTSDEKNTQVIVFPCVATTLYDLVDQQSLQRLTDISVYDGDSDSEPRQYGFIGGQGLVVLFSSPGPMTRLKIKIGTGQATRLLLINSQPSKPTGIGYAVGVASARNVNFSKPPDPNNPDDVVRNGTINNTALRVAKDMWMLDDFRIRNLAKFRIVEMHDSNNPVTHLHDIANENIQKALAAYQRLDYQAFDSYSHQAWAYESRVYPQAQQIANDVVQGVIFYLFLLIPFAYFLERLWFGFPDLKRQLAAAFSIFIAVFIVFASIHPAFSIGSVNPLIILIAFVMLALSVIVSMLVWGKFEEQLKAQSRSVSGVHKADVGKGSIAFAAFALGISNMRRRKERTLLTCLTLVLLTFTVLSFTSIVNTIRYNDVAAPGKALYNGILLRMPTWKRLDFAAFRLLNDEYSTHYPVAPRAWFYGKRVNEDEIQQTYLTLQRANVQTTIKGVAGLTPQEAQVSGVDRVLLAGRWFNNADAYSAILPKGAADSLQITPADVGRVTVNFSGVPYLVIGILDPDKLGRINDLDNEPLLPVDFQTSQQQSAATAQSFQEYDHIAPNDTLFIPYQTVINLGGELRSVALNLGTAKTVDTELKGLMPRLDLNLYAGENGSNHRFSATGTTSSQGLINILIPIIIAALIVLNTMLGSVYERVKEIAIFSSIGLSPSNIAMLFIAEAVVYGIIGAVSGYLIGQGLSALISHFHILPGLYLNFSSTSAELSIGLVVAVVLLSTIFPARKASEVATPSVDRTWHLPDPVGDTWKIKLPFAVAGSQAAGINAFLAEWFRSYEEQSVGDFLTQDIRTGSVQRESGEGYRLTGRVWLAPFDLGVSQDIELDTVPTDLENIYSVEMTLTRLSGDVSNWKRVNRRFVNVIRKQFLIWRTLAASDRERYMEEGAAAPATTPNVITGSGTVAPAL